MSRPVSRNAVRRIDPLAEMIEYVATAANPAEAFAAIADRLLSALSCQSVALQVKASTAEPLILQGGRPVTLPGIGVGWWAGEVSSREALTGEFVIHDDLYQSFEFGEDASLVRVGLRSAIRGALFADGREVGRFAAFSEQTHHFTAAHARLLQELTPGLVWLCRHTAFSAEIAVDTEIGSLMDELLTGSGQGLHAVLKCCRTYLSRTIPAAGTLAVLQTPGPRPTVLVDRVGIAIPGVPDTGDPAAWRQWLRSIPPEGLVESVAWIFPIGAEGGDTFPAGALAIAFPQSHEDPILWHRRLRPVIHLLASLVESQRVARQRSEGARRQLGALASGLADEIGNLMTDLAIQVDLLPPALKDGSEARRRIDALVRLVEKGTSLSARLEQMAMSQGHQALCEPLQTVIQRVSQHLHTYEGGKHVAIRSRLGPVGEEIVEVGAVEHAMTQLALSMAQGRTSEVQFGLHGRRSPSQPDSLVLWLAEETEEGGGPPAQAELPAADLPAPDEEGDGPLSVLEVPICTRSQPMEGSFPWKTH